MAGVAQSLSFVIRVIDQGASVGVQRVSRNVNKLDKASVEAGASVARMGAETRVMGMRAMAASAALFGLGSVVFRTTRRFAEFQLAMKATELVTQSSVSEMGRLNRTISGLAGSTEFQPTDIAEAIRLLGQAGLSVSEVREAIGSMTEVATAGMLEMKSAAELTINVMRGFRIPVHELSVTMDKLTRITQLTPLAMEEVATSLGFASASAAAFNQNIDSTVIALGILKPITKTASKAGTAFRAALQAMFRPQGVKALERLGVASVDSAGNARDLITIIQDVSQAVKTQIPEAERQAFLARLFGIRGMQLYSAVLNAQVTGTGVMEGVTLRGAQAIVELRKQLSNAHGTTGDFAKNMRQTYAKSVQMLGATISKLSISIGEALIPTAQTLTKSMTGVFQSFLAGNEALNGWPVTLGLVGAAFKALTVTYGMFKDMTMALINTQRLLAGSLAQTAVAASTATGAILGPTGAPLAASGGAAAAAAAVPWYRRNIPGPAAALGAMRERTQGVRASYHSYRSMYAEGVRQRHAGFAELGHRYGAMPLGAARRESLGAVGRRAASQAHRGLGSAMNSLATGARSAAGSLRSAATGVGNFLGPLGMGLVVFESLALAWGAYKKTVEELNDTEQKRLDRTLDQADAFGSVVSIIEGLAPGGGGIRMEDLTKIQAKGLLTLLPPKLIDAIMGVGGTAMPPERAVAIAAQHLMEDIHTRDIPEEKRLELQKKLNKTLAGFSAKLELERIKSRKSMGLSTAIAPRTTGIGMRPTAMAIRAFEESQTEANRKTLLRRLAMSGANVTGKETVEELARLLPAIKEARRAGQAFNQALTPVTASLQTVRGLDDTGFWRHSAIREPFGDVKGTHRKAGRAGLTVGEAAMTAAAGGGPLSTEAQATVYQKGLQATKDLIAAEAATVREMRKSIEDLRDEKAEIIIRIHADDDEIKSLSLKALREQTAGLMRERGINPRNSVDVSLTDIFAE